MIEDFGSYLKSERELRGVTLDELNSKTRIPIRYLQALENNQLDQLPEEVFIRGYIRSIAKVIGAQEDEVLSTYLDINSVSSSIDTNDQSTSNKKYPKFDPQFTFLLGLTILFLLGTAFGINILIQSFSKDTTESTITTFSKKQDKIKEEPLKNLSTVNSKTNNTSTDLIQTKSPSKLLTSVPKTPIEESLNNLAKKPAAKFKNLSSMVNSQNLEEKITLRELPNISDKQNTVDTSTSPNENVFPLKLNIRIKGDVWFNIMTDDSPMESFVVSKGSEKIFYGKKQYLLNAGNKNLIELTLNGKPISFLNENKNDLLTNFTINSQLIE